MDQTCNDPIIALCDLAEASGDGFQAVELDATYGTAVRLWADLVAIEPSAPIRTLTCSACDGDHPVTVEFDTATRRHSYFCPEAGLVTVDDADLVALRFNPGWLVEWLIRELPISPPVRRQELVQNRAWYLGDAMCGDTLITVIFARQVSSQAALGRLASGLRTVHPADKGLVITTSQNVVRHIPLPNGYEFLDLREIMKATAGAPTLDTTRLGSWIRGIRTTTGKGAPSRSGRPSPKPDEPEPKGRRRPSAVRATLDDLPIHIRPTVPAISGCKAKEPFRFRPLRHMQGGTAAFQSQRIFFAESVKSQGIRD